MAQIEIDVNSQNYTKISQNYLHKNTKKKVLSLFDQVVVGLKQASDGFKQVFDGLNRFQSDSNRV